MCQNVIEYYGEKKDQIRENMQFQGGVGSDL